MITAVRPAWPAPPADPSPWSVPALCRAPVGRVVRDTRLAVKARPTRRPSTAPKDTADLCGVVLHFMTLSCEQTLPAELAKLAGFDRAQLMVVTGAFDKCLRRCGVGKVRGAVRFQFIHDADLKTCSTISGALRVFADDEALRFYVRGASRDGRNSVRCAKAFTTHRQVSAGYVVRRALCFPGKNGESNVLATTEADLLEISLVPEGAFPGTCVRFL